MKEWLRKWLAPKNKMPEIKPEKKLKYFFWIPGIDDCINFESPITIQENDTLSFRFSSNRPEVFRFKDKFLDVKVVGINHTFKDEKFDGTILIVIPATDKELPQLHYVFM